MNYPLFQIPCKNSPTVLISRIKIPGYMCHDSGAHVRHLALQMYNMRERITGFLEVMDCAFNFYQKFTAEVNVTLLYLLIK